MSEAPVYTPTMVAVDAIQVPAEQPRLLLDDLDDLQASIEQHGFFSSVLLEQQPDSSYRLIHGARRLQAAQRAGLTEVPAQVYPAGRLSPAQVWLTQIDENERRKNLTPLEKALAYKRLRLMLDCEYFCDRWFFAWPQAETLAEWQAAYDQLAAAARLLGEQQLQISWPQFERIAGLKETSRKKYMRLASLEPEVQAVMQGSSLPLDALVAIAEAPAAQRLALLTAAQSEGKPYPSVVVQAAARAVRDPANQRSVAELLTAAQVQLALSPGLSPQQLSECIFEPTLAPLEAEAADGPTWTMLPVTTTSPAKTSRAAQGSTPTHKGVSSPATLPEMQQHVASFRRQLVADLRDLPADERAAALALVEETITWLTRQAHALSRRRSRLATGVTL